MMNAIRYLLLLTALALLGVLAGCADRTGDSPGGLDPTPERIDGSPSYEFEPDDLERAAGASDAVKDYCSGARSEAQRTGCESHVTDDELP